MSTPVFHRASRSVRDDAQPVPSDPAVVRLNVSIIVIEQYFSVALATLLAYHCMLTIEKEIKYFWSEPRRPVNLVYFANRYVGLLGAVFGIVYNDFSENIISCRFSYWTVSIANWITITLIDYILLIRVLALYHKKRSLDIGLKAILGLQATAALGALIYSTYIERMSVLILAEGVTFCGIKQRPPKVLILTWALPMVNGLILLVLALHKASEYWGQSIGFKGYRLVGILIRDQVIYYMLVIVCCVLRIVYIRVNNPYAAVILVSAGSPTLLCVLGDQLLINLKEAGKRGVNEGTNYRSRSLSDMEFTSESGSVVQS